ncbi:MAG: hypothetical protein NC924_02380 [Candidatus Omnitrophica bacterium]|nr:hypothetical protein [Candidatus Omnitrophota bacterium]
MAGCINAEIRALNLEHTFSQHGSAGQNLREQPPALSEEDSAELARLLARIIAYYERAK